jgi:hypothetical protein
MQIPSAFFLLFKAKHLFPLFKHLESIALILEPL